MKLKGLGLGLGALIIVSVFAWHFDKNTAKTDKIGTHPGWYAHFLKLKGDENGNLPKNLYAKWFAADKANKIANKKAENNLENIQEIGPDNVGGRTRSIIVDHSNPNRYLCVGVSGGVWVSENKGDSWNNPNDFGPTLSATTVVQSPFDKDIFYYGSGESVGNSASIGGLGIFKSSDGAKTFQHLEHTVTPALDGIWEIEHSITRDSTLYVATNNGGLWRSTNAGDTFTKIYSTGSAITEIEVFENGTIMIAIYGFGIVKIDETTLETQVMKGGNWPTGTYSRISFDFCQNYPNIMYAQVATGDRINLLGIYKTSNGGKTWDEVTYPTNASYTQAWYDFKLTVAPTDSNFVVSTAVSPTFSSNGGQSWRDMDNSHSDYHELTWESDNSLLVGNDGGVYRMNKGNMSVSTSLNNGLNITQFYAGHFYPTGNSIIGGTQDNGTRYSANSAASMPSIWGGDGSFCAVHQQNSAIRYVSSQYLNVWRTGSGNRNINSFIRNSVGGNDGVWFINPIEINNLDGDQLYVPTKKETFRTLNGGDSWIKLTADLPGESYSVGLSNDVNPTVYIGGTASRIYRVDNAATTSANQEIALWTPQKLPPSEFLGSTIGCVEVDPNNAGTIYCGLTNVSPRSRIWRIKNANTADPIWEDISSNLPGSLPVNWIEVDPQMSNHIIIATDYGLYSSLNGGLSWNKETRIPSVPVDQIRLRHSDRKLYIFTHGRGIWTADLKTNLVAQVNDLKTSELTVYPNPASDYIKLSDSKAAGTLYSMTGKKMAESANGTMVVRDVPNGTYFIEITTGEAKSVRKVIVSH
jgi:photosystem II stability/assembly factor-like uncharacterized protein